MLLGATVGIFLMALGSVYTLEAELAYSTDPPSVLSSPLFPCSQCHADVPIDKQKKQITFHTEKLITGHGEPLKWCFDCHNADNLDTLRLIGGEEVEFRQVQMLCGQCHGKLYEYWKAGSYGKRTGYWDGEKKYSLCTDCHDPHSPRFTPIEPDPAPHRPEETLR